jgi:hypothetical protein
MPTQITIPVLDDAEAWIRENFHDLFTDSVCSVLPDNVVNLDGKTRWTDSYDDAEVPEKMLGMEDYIKGLSLLFNQIGRKWKDEKGNDRGLFVGGITNPHDLLDPGCWDAEVVDAYFQLCYYGDVIYG